MKADIHPKFQDITFTCSCGATFVAGSTLEKDFKTEICSNCHPFYTGKQKLIDKSGRVDKFIAKRKKAQELAEKKVKKIKNEDAEEVAKETAEELEENTIEITKEEKKPKAKAAPKKAPAKKTTAKKTTKKAPAKKTSTKKKASEK